MKKLLQFITSVSLLCSALQLEAMHRSCPTGCDEPRVEALSEKERNYRTYEAYKKLINEYPLHATKQPETLQKWSMQVIINDINDHKNDHEYIEFFIKKTGCHITTIAQYIGEKKDNLQSLINRDKEWYKKLRTWYNVNIMTNETKILYQKAEMEYTKKMQALNDELEKLKNVAQLLIEQQQKSCN